MMGLRKILSVIATSALLFNSLSPSLIVLAQEVTPSPAPIDTSTPTPTDQSTPSASPTNQPTTTSSAASPTALPTDQAIATPTDSTTLTASPTAQPTDTPTDQPVVTQAPESNPTTTAPPDSTTASPSVQPTATPEAPKENGHISTTVVENVDLSTINLLNSNVDIATVTTDKPDYSPTDIVLITGTGFIANKDYTLEIVSTDQPPVDFKTPIKADSSGNISYAYQLDGNYRPNYAVYVKSGEVITASTTFTDSGSADFKQCANSDSPTPTGTCHWIGSILQQNNSTYFEGMSVPQRVILTDISATVGNVHTLTFSHQANKSSSHAYDFITAYNQGNNPSLTLNECTNFDGTTNTTCTSLVSGGFSATPDAPDALGIVSGDDVANRVSAYEALYGNRTVKIFGSSSISSASISFNGYTGGSDKDANYTLTWTSTSTNILIEMGGHLAIGGDGTGATYGPGKGSSDISGGPYHFMLDKLDNHSLGSQDNQIKGADILPPSAGKIFITKNTVDADGTFNYTATGSGLFNFAITTTGNTGTQSFNGLVSGNTGGSRSVTETIPGGWTLTGLSCVSANQTSTTSTNIQTGTATISNLGRGDIVTCTFTNTLQQAHLIVIKHVINDNGGAASAGNFTLDSGGTNDSPDNFAGVEQGTNVTLDAGSYNVTESGPSGYTATYSTDCSGSIAAGQTKTCTVTNNDNAPSLTLNKVLIEDNGGVASESDWTLTATGNQDIPVILSGPGAAGSTDVVSNSSFKVGTYALSESSLVTGYSASAWSCAGGSQNGDQITLGLGESATCTITNDDNKPQLHLRKTITKDNGGTSDVTDWNLTATGTLQSPTNLSGPTPVDSTTGFKADTYTLGETGPSGYAAGTWDCGQATMPDATHVTVPLGANITCSINNNDKPGTLTVKKVVINDNGGTFTPDDFSFQVNGGAITPFTQIDPTHGENDLTVDAGSYTITEPTVSGYTTTYDNCTGVSVPNGGSATCTITNDDQAGTLIIVKNTVGGDGTFNFTVGGPTSSSQSIATVKGSGQTLGLTVNAGTYSVDETVPAGWDLTGSDCGRTVTGAPISTDSFIIANGQTVTCTFTNEKYGYMQGRKYSDTNMDGRLENNESFLDGWTIRLYGSDWQLLGTQTTGNNGLLQGQYKFENLLPGTYYACEVQQNGFTQTGPILGSHAVDYNNNKVNDSTAVSNGSGQNDEAQNCWQSNINGDAMQWLGFGNIQYGNIIVKKATDTETEQRFRFSSNFSGGNFYLSSGGTFNSGYLLPGTYNVSELTQKGWVLKSATCDDGSLINAINLQQGENVTCTFTNTELRPGISITKSNNAGGGIGAGGTVTYTLVVENTGNVDFDNVVVTDILPGGFTYVDGSTTGGATFVPPQVGPKLTWNTGTLGAHSSITITYQLQTNGGLSDGDYKNFATCTATYDGQSTKSCNQTDSTVTIGHNVNYGGNLGQVLGISTELPATGNPTGLLAFALGTLTIGLYMRGFNGKKSKRNAKN